MQQNIRGIIVHQIDYKETSKILYVITPYGKINVIAQGVKRYKKGLMYSCDMLCQNDFVITSKEPHKLIDVDLICWYSNIKEDFNKLLHASILCEITHRMPIIDEAKTYYHFLEKTLNHIENTKEYAKYTFIFLMKSLKLFGVGPDFKRQPNKIVQGFNIKNGLAYNPNECDINLEDTICLKNLYLFDDSKQLIEEIKITNVKIIDFINQYYEFHLGITLKSMQMITL